MPIVPLKTFSLNTLIRKKGTQERWEYEGDDIPLLRRVLTPIDVHSVGLCMTIGAGISFPMFYILSLSFSCPPLSLSLTLFRFIVSLIPVRYLLLLALWHKMTRGLQVNFLTYPSPPLLFPFPPLPLFPLPLFPSSPLPSFSYLLLFSVLISFLLSGIAALIASFSYGYDKIKQIK